MEIDLLKIIEAFKIKISPSEDQKELALKRIDVCSECTHRRGEISSATVSCSDCGCFLKGKIFTNVEGECPKGKWDEIDKPYFKIKQKKTFI